MLRQFAGVVAAYGAVVVLSLATSTPALADDGDALVIVNGKPIARQQVVDMLMETHGLQMMQQLIVLELAKQETARRKIQVTPADVQAQYDRAVEEIAPTRDAAGVTLSDAEKQQMLQKVLRDKCLTLPEFKVAMERNAHLRKIAEQDFTVDEPTLREEFARTYGERAEVRDIALRANDTAALHEALDRLARGDDFAQVARELSVNADDAARGGALAPIAFTDQKIPPAIRDVVFSLRPGEVSSPTLAGDLIHILKLERRVPPTDVKFEDMRGEVETKLRERVVRQKMTELITKLFDQAKIRVLDPKLKKEFDDLVKQRAAAQPPTP